MAGERLVMAVDRVLQSRGFLRWGGVLLGAVGLAAAAFLFWDANRPGVDAGSRTGQQQFAGGVGLVGFALLCGGAAAWAGGRSQSARPGVSPHAEPGAAVDPPKAAGH